MLYFVAACFAVALFAGVSGFTAIAEAAADLGRLLLLAFGVAVVLSMLIHLAQHRWSRRAADASSEGSLNRLERKRE